MPFYRRIDSWTGEFDSELRDPSLSVAGLKEILEAIQRLDTEGHQAAQAYLEEDLPAWLQPLSKGRKVWAMDLPRLGRRITFVVLAGGRYRLLSTRA
jgi:hypothetical protein